MTISAKIYTLFGMEMTLKIYNDITFSCWFCDKMSKYHFLAQKVLRMTKKIKNKKWIKIKIKESVI